MSHKKLENQTNFTNLKKSKGATKYNRAILRTALARLPVKKRRTLLRSKGF